MASGLAKRRTSARSLADVFRQSRRGRFSFAERLAQAVRHSSLFQEKEGQQNCVFYLLWNTTDDTALRPCTRESCTTMSMTDFA